MDFDLAHWRSPRTIYNPSNQQIYGAAYQNGLCGFNTRFGIFSEVNALPLCGSRTVTSHEMGHSFGCPHSTGIMASPYAGCTDLWDATAISVVNALIPTSLCLGLSPTCPIPNSINIPPNLAFICTGIEECFTYTDNLCVGGFSVSSTDPYLQITVSGTTICLLESWHNPALPRHAAGLLRQTPPRILRNRVVFGEFVLTGRDRSAWV